MYNAKLILIFESCKSVFFYFIDVKPSFFINFVFYCGASPVRMPAFVSRSGIYLSADESIEIGI